MEESKALFATIHGVVQGVSFRYHTLGRARRLGLAGYVRNRTDGSVEVVAEGPQANLNQLLKWLAKGPNYAHVTRVDHHFQSATGAYPDFDVRY